MHIPLCIKDWYQLLHGGATPLLILHADINECVVNNGSCEQICINLIGSFECQCYENFTLDSDGSSCSGKQQ